MTELLTAFLEFWNLSQGFLTLVIVIGLGSIFAELKQLNQTAREIAAKNDAAVLK